MSRQTTESKKIREPVKDSLKVFAYRIEWHLLRLGKHFVQQPNDHSYNPKEEKNNASDFGQAAIIEEDHYRNHKD